MVLDEDQAAIRDMARDFARREIVPHAADWDREEIVPTATLARMGELGLMGICVPERWGGTGADFVAYAAAMEEIAYGDAGVSNVMAATNSPFASGLNAYGTDAQKETYLRPIAEGKAVAAFLLTEPGTGSDAAALQTRATRTSGGWTITGSKSFITAGETARFGMILAVTDPAAGKRGISCFITRTDVPGYLVVRREKKLGHRTCDTCQIALDDLEVSDDQMLGAPGEGLKIAFSLLDNGRVGVAAQAVGVAQAALDAALAYARERRTFGKEIIRHQAVAFELAEMATKVEAARQLYLHAASLKVKGVACIREASMSKLFASEVAEQVTSSAIQVLGGYGFLNDYPVEKYYRDARVFRIYEGTSEIQKMLISRELENS